MKPEEIISLIDKIIWPLFFVIIIFLNLKSIKRIFQVLIFRIEHGAEIQFGGFFKVGQMPDSFPIPQKNEAVDENHLAIVHSSWRYPKKDIEFRKRMYVIQVLIIANKEVMRRIEYVRYSLHPTYQDHQFIKRDRKNSERFEFKELAWGEFILRAEVKIEEQDKLINLSRYINLTETGKNLLTRRFEE